MTLDEIKIVQSSFNRIFSAHEALGKAFYERLFEIAPCARAMFPGDMESMHLKLVDMLDYAVLNLDKPHLLEETVTELAQRHVSYGTLPEHFPPVGQALLEVMGEHSPGGLTPPEVDAWTSTFVFISEIMIEEMQKKVA